MTGRSNECGVNRLQETQKITSQYEVHEETSLSWLNEQGPIRFLERSSMIFGPDLSSGSLPVDPFLQLERDYAVTLGVFLNVKYILHE